MAHQQGSDEDVDMLLEASEDMIGRYQTLEDLGVGGYSRVKLAIDTQSKVKVALKILLSEPKENPKTKQKEWIITDSKVKQCKREIKLMQQIQHKNVVALHDFIDNATFPQEDENNKMVKTPCLCVVLEYCSRGELFDFLMYTGRLGERATRTYFQQFLNGLKAMHDSGYAHRDLKPENLLLSDDFTLKIADFGFATEFKDNAKRIKMATTCGTKGYLAPELLQGHKYTHKVDLFAVGIIMFTTFAGFPPFQHAGHGDWWWDKMQKAWTYWTEAPRVANEIESKERHKKGNEKIRLFWAAHERSLPFDNNFKDLMENLLNPYPTQRYDIDDVFKHSWMKGKTFSRRQLVKYMKQYSSTVRAQRAIKIRKQIADMAPEKKGNIAKRILLDHAKPEQFEQLTIDFEAALDKQEEAPAIVDKVRFRFDSTQELLAILLSIEKVARSHGGTVDMNVKKCELKISAGISREAPGKGQAVMEAEEMDVMVKIFRAKETEMEDIPDFTFDLEGDFLGDDDDDDDDDDEKDEKMNGGDKPKAAPKKESKAASKAAPAAAAAAKDKSVEKKWTILFYRINGSADGFQQLMGQLFYHPEIHVLMNVEDVYTLTQKSNQEKALGRAPECVAAFRNAFNLLEINKKNEKQMDGIEIDIGP